MMENKLRSKGLYAFTFLVFLSVASNAQINITLGSAGRENFNSIDASARASLPANWKMSAADKGNSAIWSTVSNVATVKAVSQSAGGATYTFDAIVNGDNAD